MPISSFFPIYSSSSSSSSTTTTTSSSSSTEAGIDILPPWLLPPVASPNIGNEGLPGLPFPFPTPPVATLTPPRIPTVTQPVPQSAPPSTTFASFLPSSGRDDFRADSSSASSSESANYPSSATVTVTQTALDPSTQQAPAPTVTAFISVTVSNSFTVTVPVTLLPSTGVSAGGPASASLVFPSTTTDTQEAPDNASASAPVRGEPQRSSSRLGAGGLAGKGIAIGVCVTVVLVCAAVAFFWYLRCYRRRCGVGRVNPFTGAYGCATGFSVFGR